MSLCCKSIGNLLRIVVILSIVMGLHAQLLWLKYAPKPILSSPPVVVKLLNIKEISPISQIPKIPPQPLKNRQILPKVSSPPLPKKAIRAKSIHQKIKPLSKVAQINKTSSWKVPNQIQPLTSPSVTSPPNSPPVTQPSKLAPVIQQIIPPAKPLPPVADSHNLPPAYPLMARRREEEGRVLLKVKVDERGQVETVQINQSSGSLLLDEAALQAVSQWRFKPASQAGKAVSAWVKVPIVFRLRE